MFKDSSINNEGAFNKFISLVLYSFAAIHFNPLLDNLEFFLNWYISNDSKTLTLPKAFNILSLLLSEYE